MEIKNLNNISVEELKHEIKMGAKFVMYQYCISIVIMTFRRPSAIYFIRNGESAVSKGLMFSLISFVMGWWGIPWGPIYTIGSISTNFTGGKDLTVDVVRSMGLQDALYASYETQPQINH